MMITHFILGFITSYIGFTPPSMLNLTASKIFLEKDKKAAYQFTLGVSVVVFAQFFLSFLIVSYINNSPEILFWIRNIAIVVFAIISVFFLRKGMRKSSKKKVKNYKNNFIHGFSLSFINMFAIPFFAISYSFLLVEGFINSTSESLITYALGIFLGTIAILISYIFLMKKFEEKMSRFTKFYNPVIGVITGFFAVYSAVKLYL